MESRRVYSSLQSAKSLNYFPFKNQLQLEVAILLPQRKRYLSQKNRINNYYTLNQYSQDIRESSIPQEVRKSYNSNKPVQTRNSQKVKKISQKINQVIELCNQNPSLQQIVQAQIQVLDHLHKTRKQQNSSPKCQYKQSPMSYSKNNKQNTIRQQAYQKGFVISDDIMEMIQEVQQKTVLQIEKLRSDKIQLMKRINEQMKLHNKEKIKCGQFKQRVKRLNEQLRRKDPLYMGVNTQENIQQLKQINQNEESGYFSQPKQITTSQAIKRKPKQAHSKKHNGQRENLSKSPLFGRFAQSMDYSNPNILKTSYPKANQNNSQIQLQNQIKRLQHQNKRFRNVLSQQSSRNISPLKNNLKNQLKFLEEKRQQYEHILYNQHKNNDQNQTLYLQAANLAAQGRRLMKAKSNPNLRSLELEPVSQELFEVQKPQYKKRLFESINRSKYPQYSSYYHQIEKQKNFVNEYQKLIQSMNKIVNY